MELRRSILLVGISKFQGIDLGGLNDPCAYHALKKVINNKRSYEFLQRQLSEIAGFVGSSHEG